jgi:DNA (cytosine-5)-methyltransferase 1
VVEVVVNAVDLFAGAGGWSHGWREATGVEPLVAVNHCAHAIRLHTLNHPATEHFLEDVWSVDPATAVAGRRVDWLHGSPDCTHFSRAKGGKPREQKIRGLAWVLVDWARAARPRFLSIENVAEFETWGPLDAEGQPIKARAGETFREFVAALRGLGYAVDWRVLCAADFGAPTIRRRLFLVARRDGQPIRWPEPTHADPSKRDLFSAGLQPWRTAAECIDWSIPCPSIFGRKRPLAPATCRRIAAGIVRFVLQGRPFLVNLSHGGRVEAIDDPMRTITAKPRGGDRALVAAFLQQNFTGMVGKPLRVPVPTITARDHHSLVAATMVQTGYGERRGQAPRALDLEQPLGTIVAGGAKHALVAAFLTTYYGQGGTANAVDKPMPAVVTKARHGLVTVEIDGVDYAIADIGLRMLEPRELARAQGFPDSYVLEGTKAEQIARIGNSVVPQVAAAIVRANLGRKACVA